MNMDGKTTNTPSNWTVFFEQLEKFNQFIEYTFSYPLLILENVVNNIISFVTNHTVTFTICFCLGITFTFSIASIAIGLGIGLGVGCARVHSNYNYNNSTSG